MNTRPTTPNILFSTRFYFLAAMLLMVFSGDAQTLTSIAAFDRDNTGASPRNLIQGKDGNFYGTASENGPGGSGTVFKVTSSGTLSAIASLDGTKGATPRGGVVQGSDGNFYGLAMTGGASGMGTVFKATTNGTVSALLSFNSVNGESPRSPLVLGTNGNFFGLASSGGTNVFSTNDAAFSPGLVFEITAAGVYKTLFSFHGPDGMEPTFLIKGADGNFYGTTSKGGIVNTNEFLNSGYGTVFRLTPAGTLTTLAKFPGGAGGKFPSFLTQGKDGNFYGTTDKGGNSSDYGTVFKMTPAGTLSTLVTFNGANGSKCPGFVQAPDGNFYGVTYSGGTANLGTIFKMTTSGSLTTLFSFNGTNGSHPRSPPILAADNNVYGTTGDGSVSGFGTVYRLNLPSVLPKILSQPLSQTVIWGAKVSFSVTSTNGPFTYQWQKNGTTISNATTTPFTLTSVTTNNAGSYRVIVKNSFGSATSSTAVLKVVVPPTPKTPTNIIASALSSSAISVKWSNAATNISGFIIWRGTSSNATTLRLASVSSAARGFTNSGLASSTTYFYSVQATNAGGLSAKSPAVSARTLLAPPTAPINLTATALSPTRVSLSWQKTSTNTTGFTLFRSPASGGSYVALLNLSATTLTYIDASVHSGLSYYYVIKAYNTAGSSTNSVPTFISMPVGLADNLVWYNGTNGAFALWVMNQTNLAGYGEMPIGPTTNSGWRVPALGDLNNDFNSDIFWQHTNGSVAVWLMHGNGVRTNIALPKGPDITSGWKIFSAPDLNKDGFADLLWQNTSNAAVACWLVRSPTNAVSIPLRTGLDPKKGWRIAGTADLDGNLSKDIVWANTNGALSAWMMSGTNYLSTVPLRTGYASSTGWSLSGLLDLTGDKKTDLVWMKSNGQLECWVMNGTNYVRSVALTPSSLGWQLVGPK